MLITQFDTEQVISSLDAESNNLLLIGEKTPIDIDRLIEQANEHNYQIAGGIFPRVISGGQHLEEGIIIKSFEGELKPILLENVGLGELDLSLPDFSSDYQSCMVLVDGLMKNIPRLLERLYEKYWNTVHFVGGGAGSLSLQQTPCVFTNEGLFQDAAILLPIASEANSGVTHGWKKIAGPFVANKTDGNLVEELNWRPAYDVYKEIVEGNSDLKFSESDFFSISKGFPFGIKKEGQEVIVRDPIAVDDSGVLTCVGNVSRNVSLYILQGESEALIESASAAASKATELKGFKNCLVIDCISRVLYLEDNFEKELDVIREKLKVGDVEEVEGALTLGEISSGNDGILELYNKTTVVTTFK